MTALLYFGLLSSVSLQAQNCVHINIRQGRLVTSKWDEYFEDYQNKDTTL
jgi:hypothetical protein